MFAALVCEVTKYLEGDKFYVAASKLASVRENGKFPAKVCISTVENRAIDSKEIFVNRKFRSFAD